MYSHILWSISFIAIYTHVGAANKNVSIDEIFNNDFDDFIPVAYTTLQDPFDWKLLQQFTSAKGFNNVIVSPLSLKIVLALLYEGSAGATEKEFQSVLNFPQDKRVLRQNYSDLLDVLSLQRQDYIVNIGSRIFLDHKLVPNETYRTRALHTYKSDVVQTNFSDPHDASEKINSWVEDATKGHIRKIVTPDDLADAVLLLTNAIYFKGLWNHEFPKNRSYDGGFYLKPNHIASVRYMSKTDTYFYVESKTLNAQVIRIPYKGRKFAMFIILPNSKSGLSNLLENLDYQALKRTIQIMDQIPVELILPKFKFHFQTRYSSVLYDLGLRTMFQSAANFPDIVEGANSKLVVTDIVQKAGIEVNEEGSVSYAATVVQIGNKFGEPDTVFNATHPFLFFIEEESTHTILFVGKVENPLEMKPIPLPSRFGNPEPTEATKAPITETYTQLPNSQPSPASYPTIQEQINKGSNHFDLDLLKNSYASGNVFISPASIKATLGMILEGSAGYTADEIIRALKLPVDNNKRQELLYKYISEISDGGWNTTLETTNGVFVSDKYRIIPEYENKLHQFFRAHLKTVSFDYPNRAADQINTFINNATRGLIPEIVSPAQLDHDTAIVLTNAIYFKASWKTEFEPQATSIKCFMSPKKGCINTYMMGTIENYRYTQLSDETHLIELPYSNGKHAMLLMVPKETNGVERVLNNLQSVSLIDLLNKLESTEIHLTMPRFEIEYSAEIIPVLKRIGVRDAFENKANLSSMVYDKHVYINSVIHKTKIEVNEKGTEAAGATGAIVIPLIGSATPRINVDHPFIFFIYNIKTGDVLFEGILNEPTEAKATLGNKLGNIAPPQSRPSNLAYNYDASYAQPQFRPLERTTKSFNQYFV